MIITLIIAAVTVALDQISKYLVLQNIPLHGNVLVIPGLFHFTYVENKGAAFGILSDHRWVFMAVSVVAIAAFVFYIVKFCPKDKLLLISMSMIIGGGVGNMIDRVARGSVVDFIEVDFMEFAVFNVADIFVCVGCGLMILDVILSEVREQKSKKEKTENDT